ncbi:MAG TPA: hypothetical protein VEW69_08725 [Alphaproteobacteria bacterium]|nr:hypothetical protein [Alphaproteobacteria bacterium]
MFGRILAAALLFSAFSILQAQTRSHGLPASVNSPTMSADGRSIVHGLPASVNSPTPIGRFSTLPRHDRRFADRRRHHNQAVVFPVYYPIYSSPFYDPAAAPEMEVAPEPEASSSVDLDAVRRAYLQGARDAVAVQERTRAAAPRVSDRKLAAPSTQETESNNSAEASARVARQPSANQQEEQPADEPGAYDPTVFIFKDGHQVESNNFVIAGKVLMDFSHKPMKKISLADLDTDATRKANDERGTSIRLP